MVIFKLSIYNDYYFAFIHNKGRVNAQYNAKANRELRKYANLL